MLPIISIREAKRIVAKKSPISLDLGKSQISVVYDGDFLVLGEERYPISEFKDLKDNFCYTLRNGKLNKVEFFSKSTNYYYKLVPTQDWPTFTIGSVPMHQRFKVTPKQDAMNRIKCISPIKGRVLDCCCGLGYTAILSAKSALEVHTFEKFVESAKICEMNPYSQELYTNKKIHLYKEDVAEGIKSFKSQYFDRVIHDPPTNTISPELYEKEFYAELFRVMKQNGILHHYVPRTGKLKGEELYLEVLQNLEKVGFIDLKYDEVSSGVIARKDK